MTSLYSTVNICESVFLKNLWSNQTSEREIVNFVVCEGKDDNSGSLSISFARVKLKCRKPEMWYESGSFRMQLQISQNSVIISHNIRNPLRLVCCSYLSRYIPY
jgi:hypothetical protein